MWSNHTVFKPSIVLLSERTMPTNKLIMAIKLGCRSQKYMYIKWVNHVTRDVRALLEFVIGKPQALSAARPAHFLVATLPP